MSIISGSYASDAAFELLAHVLANGPRQYVKNNQERGIDFSTTWTQVSSQKLLISMKYDFTIYPIFSCNCRTHVASLLAN